MREGVGEEIDEEEWGNNEEEGDDGREVEVVFEKEKGDKGDKNDREWGGNGVRYG